MHGGQNRPPRANKSSGGLHTVATMFSLLWECQIVKNTSIIFTFVFLYGSALAFQTQFFEGVYEVVGPVKFSVSVRKEAFFCNDEAMHLLGLIVYC